MTYIDRINAMERWLETNYLPGNAQLLYYKLLALCNRSGWPEWVQVDNQRLMAMIQVSSKGTLIRARENLEEAGFVDYEKGRKGVPGRYRLKTPGKPFCPKNGRKTEPMRDSYGTNVEPQTELMWAPYIDKDKDIDKDKENTLLETKSIQRQGSGKKKNQECDFNLFWEAWPNKIKEGPARTEWMRINPGPDQARTIVDALNRQKEHSQWKKDNGRWIPHPDKWLRERRWNDDVSTWPKEPDPKASPGKAGRKISNRHLGAEGPRDFSHLEE